MKGITGYLMFIRDTVIEAAIARPEVQKSNNPSVFSGPIRFKFFAVLWAVATLFHMAHSSVFNTQLNLALLTLVAIWTIFRPSLTAFIALIVLQLFDALFRMPYTTNHWIFTAFVNITILQALVFLTLRYRSFNVTGEQLLDTFAPVVRAALIILYFFTFFHKLNSGFFAVGTSCATTLLEAQHLDFIFPVVPQLYAYNAYFTLVIELAIPLMLCFHKTRNTAIVLALIFHGILSYSTYNAFYDFSSMIFAVLFLFAPPGFYRSVINTVQDLKERFMRNVSGYSFMMLMLLTAGVVFSLALILLFNKKLDTFKEVHLFFWTIYLLAYLVFFICFSISQRGRRVEISERNFAMPHWSFVLILLVIFLNGASPYLGLKTENSYAMFSNLRTEGGVSNHFVIPASTQIFGFQNDVVEIIGSSDPLLQKFANENKLLVWFEFKNLVHERKPQKIEYLLNGERHTFSKGEASSQAIPENPYLLSKLMRFRAFSKNEPQPCVH